MPELPEVQTTVDGLNTKVLSRTFVDVWTDWEKTVKKPKGFLPFKKELKNKKILKVYRRAKNVIFELSNGYSLLIHMKMTGHLMVGTWKKHGKIWEPIGNEALKEKINTYLHIIFFLDNKKMIALSDLRKFAKIELWNTKELLQSSEFLAIGPEPLEKTFTYKKFEELFTNLPNTISGKRGKIKHVLMVPTVIAGIGNIYSSEALWWAKIHPEKLAGKLTEKELALLYSAIKKVLKAGIDFGGDSFSDYRNVDGKKGTFDNTKKVYQREGEKCYRCKTPIKRIVIGARSAFFCPSCQTL